jgi:hypothetical protein
MPHLAMTALAVVLVAAAPPPSKVETLAELYGETLGAAASCPNLPRARLDAVTKLAAAHLKAELDQPAAERAVSARLDAGIERGRQAVASGGETCAQAMSEFDNLESDLKR